MPIDWFTVLAQAVNFLILVWLLKRFLYQPILYAIDEREKGIATQLAEAEAKKTDAQKERDDLQHKNEAFDQERVVLLKKATEEANAERQRLLDEARKDADALRAKRHEALRVEQQTLSHEITHWTQKQVFAITRKTLTDLASTTLEEHMGAVFVRRLRDLNGAAKEQLAAAFKTSTQPVRVRSAFDLPPEQHAAIQNALNETFSADIHIQFETVPELVSGIEISANGQKVAWTIAEYLATLEKNAGELLRKEEKGESNLVPNAALKPGPMVEAEPQSKTEAKTKPEPVPAAPKGTQ